jgi:hypothetical protein
MENDYACLLASSDQVWHHSHQNLLWTGSIALKQIATNLSVAGLVGIADMISCLSTIQSCLNNRSVELKSCILGIDCCSGCSSEFSSSIESFKAVICNES